MRCMSMAASASRDSLFFFSMLPSPPRMVIATQPTVQMTRVAPSTSTRLRSRGALLSHHSFALSRALAMAVLHAGGLDGDGELAVVFAAGLALRAGEIGEALRLLERALEGLDSGQRVLGRGRSRHRLDGDLPLLDVDVLDVDLDLFLGRQPGVERQQQIPGGHL